jgi:NifB/MoaA-like Fe-S oxidoreductase
VAEPLAARTGAVLEVIPVENSLFGSSVTCAGLLPGAAIQRALAGRRDLDMVLIPGESVNDEGLFMDSMSYELLAAAVPMELRRSKDFVDALGAVAA